MHLPFLPFHKSEPKPCHDLRDLPSHALLPWGPVACACSQDRECASPGPLEAGPHPLAADGEPAAAALGCTPLHGCCRSPRGDQACP